MKVYRVLIRWVSIMGQKNSIRFEGSKGIILEEQKKKYFNIGKVGHLEIIKFYDKTANIQVNL